MSSQAALASKPVLPDYSIHSVQHTKSVEVIVDDKITLKRGDMVRNKKSRQVYHVIRVNDDGTLRLYKHGRPRVRRANPDNWELVTMKPLIGSKPTAPDMVVYRLNREAA